MCCFRAVPEHKIFNYKLSIITKIQLTRIIMEQRGPCYESCNLRRRTGGEKLSSMWNWWEKQIQRKFDILSFAYYMMWVEQRGTEKTRKIWEFHLITEDLDRWYQFINLEWMSVHWNIVKHWWLSLTSHPELLFYSHQ